MMIGEWLRMWKWLALLPLLLGPTGCGNPAPTMQTIPGGFGDGKAGEAYSKTVEVTSPKFVAKPTLEVKPVYSGKLPPGLSLKIRGGKPRSNPVYLDLSGTPTKAGVYRFTVRVVSGRTMTGWTDRAGKTFEVTIRD